MTNLTDTCCSTSLYPTTLLAAAYGIDLLQTQGLLDQRINRSSCGAIEDTLLLRAAPEGHREAATLLLYYFIRALCLHPERARFDRLAPRDH